MDSKQATTPDFDEVSKRQYCLEKAIEIFKVSQHESPLELAEKIQAFLFKD